MKKLFFLLSLLFGYFNSTQAQHCYPANAFNELNVNNVNTRIYNFTDKWRDVNPSFSPPHYEVPKGSGKNALNAGTIWIGGYDDNGVLKTAAMTYRQNVGMDYFPGPIGNINGSLTFDTSNCTRYNKVWSFNKSDILDFLNNGNITNDMLTYPANGNTSVGEMQILSPFYDADNNGLYEPSKGDFPLMDVYSNLPLTTPQLYGDQCLYAICNDFAGTKTETRSLPLGIEIHQQSFAFSSPVAAINNTTFYLYRIINRSNFKYDSVFVGHWTDPKLGAYFDNYIGCNVPLNIGFCYNADNNDDDGTGTCYGLNPPAIGIKLLQGPRVGKDDGLDNNHNGITDEADERWGMSKFMNYWSDFTHFGSPEDSLEYYYYLSGYWKNGQRWSRDNIKGTNPGYPPTDYFYPGTTDPAYPGSDWTEFTAGNSPYFRLFVMTTGPFTLDAGQEETIIYAVIWSSSGVSNMASLDTLLKDAVTIQNFYNNNFNLNTTQPDSNAISVSIFPNPSKDFVQIEINQTSFNTHFKLELRDLCGKFIEQKDITNNRHRLNIHSLAKGVYTCSVYNNDGFKAVRKIIKL